MTQGQPLDPGGREVAPDATAGMLDASRLGAVRRVLFFGKSMSRTRCTGCLLYTSDAADE